MSETTNPLQTDNYGSSQARSTNVQRHGDIQPTADLIDYAKEYAREKPEVAALWCLGIGFVLGWKLKPW